MKRLSLLTIALAILLLTAGMVSLVGGSGLLLAGHSPLSESPPTITALSVDAYVEVGEQRSGRSRGLAEGPVGLTSMTWLLWLFCLVTAAAALFGCPVPPRRRPGWLLPVHYQSSYLKRRELKVRG